MGDGAVARQRCLSSRVLLKASAGRWCSGKGCWAVIRNTCRGMAQPHNIPLSSDTRWSVLYGAGSPSPASGSTCLSCTEASAPHCGYGPECGWESSGLGNASLCSLCGVSSLFHAGFLGLLQVGCSFLGKEQGSLGGVHGGTRRFPLGVWALSWEGTGPPLSPGSLRGLVDGDSFCVLLLGFLSGHSRHSC